MMSVDVTKELKEFFRVRLRDLRGNTYSAGRLAIKR
jgi:hypothetical protein